MHYPQTQRASGISSTAALVSESALCRLQHQDVSSASLTAVKSNVLISGVWVKPADALFIAEEVCSGGVTEWRICLVFRTGNWI